MRTVAWRILSELAVAAFWIIAGARLILDLIGYATVPEDVQVAGALIHSFLLWVMGVPVWLAFGFALFATVCLIQLSRPPFLPSEPKKQNKTNQSPTNRQPSLDEPDVGSTYGHATLAKVRPVEPQKPIIPVAKIEVEPALKALGEIDAFLANDVGHVILGGRQISNWRKMISSHGHEKFMEHIATVRTEKDNVAWKLKQLLQRHSYTSLREG